MARFGYIPYDQDREDQKAEEKAERRRMFNEPVDLGPEPDVRFGHLDPEDEEFASVDSFAEYLFDDDRATYSCHELQCVWHRSNGLRLQQIKAALAEYGLTLEDRPKVRNVRGYNDNPHNRWAGNPMAGGGGGNSIIGLAD
jgi:hypothetical protein